VITDDELSYTYDDVKMTYPNVVVNRAFLRIDDAQTDLNTLADTIAKTDPVEWAFQKGRQQRDQTECH
jgi:hypothetical protein